jgi:putative hydrolase of the HAD superfamily
MPSRGAHAPITVGVVVQIATFDFHNTVAYCDTWFELEIRTLPASVIEALGLHVNDPGATTRATEAYRHLRRSVMESGIERDAQASVEHVFDQIGLNASRQLIATTIDRLMRDAKVDLEPVPGSVETISTIIDAGVPVGIISAAVYHPFLEWALDELGLLDRLAFVVTSASAGYYKSDTRLYHHVYRSANASPELGVHVGDSPRWDVQVAQQAGLGTVLYVDESRDLRPTARAEVASDIVLTSMVDAYEPILRLLEERRQAWVAP